MDNPDIIIESAVSLAALTSWRIGGVARHLATVSSVVGLQHALQFAEQQRLPVWILGGGSNILMSDAGLNGVVIRMRDQHLHIVEHSDQAHIHIGAGAQMAGPVRRLSKQGWCGLTWAEGLPGTVGGAVYGNAGCYGITLQRGDAAALATAMASTAALRRSKTPQGSSCGSVFKNPPGDSAGRLIDAAGLRGYTYGGAMVAEKHANYIVNRDQATSADVLHIMHHVRAQVDRIFGIQLEPEVQLLGDMTL